MIKMHYTEFPMSSEKLGEKKKTQNTKLFAQGVGEYTCKRWDIQGELTSMVEEKPKSTVNKHYR